MIVVNELLHSHVSYVLYKTNMGEACGSSWNFQSISDFIFLYKTRKLQNNILILGLFRKTAQCFMGGRKILNFFTFLCHAVACTPLLILNPFYIFSDLIYVRRKKIIHQRQNIKCFQLSQKHSI